MAKFKLVWENNPDTPITASNLSKIIQDYNSENILYFDNNNFIGNADNKLKIRANSKFVTTKQSTIAFFGFDNSLVSHNSKYSANTAENINYRIETPLYVGKSLALETGTTNKILNGDFSNGLNNWISTSSGGGNVSLANEGLYQNKSALLTTSSLTSESKIEQAIQFPQVPTSDDNPNVSISFYYKSNKDLKFLIIGRYSSSLPLYWNNNPNGLRWEQTSSASLITIPPSNNAWKRIEIKNIRTNSLWSSDSNEHNNVKLSIFTNEKNASIYIDGVQIEEKEYCSTFTSSSREESIIKYDNEIIRPDQGLIDFEFMPKKFNSTKNVLFRLEMVPQYNSSLDRYYNDAMRLELGSSAISFFIYDVTTQTEKQLSKSLTTNAFNNLIDNWHRIIISWRQSNGLMKLAFDNDLPINLNQSYVFTNLLLENKIELGGSGAEKFEGLLSSIKFNIFSKENEDLILDIQNPPKSDKIDYKVFECSNESIVVDTSYLDIGSSFSPSTEYYIYLVDCDGEEEEIDIVVSSNAITPNNTCKFFSNKIGGFKTDSSGNIIVSSLWDIKTKSNTTIMAERLIVHGKDSQTNNIEFRTTPYGDNSDAKFNVPVYVTNHLYGKVGSTDFLDIHPSGYLTVDNLKLDGSTITSLSTNDLLLTSSSGRKVDITSDNIDLNAGTGDIHLDNLRVKTNTIRASTGNLTITNNLTTSEVIIASNTGISRITGTTHTNQATTTNINSTTTNISSTTTNISSTNVNITATTALNITSGTTPTYIDNLSFKTNTITTKSGNLIFNSGTNDLLLTSSSGRKVDITSDNIDLNAGTGDIHLDNLRVKTNTIRASTGNLTITNNLTTSEVIIASNNGISRITGTTHTNQAITTNINSTTTNINSTTTNINSTTTNISSTTTNINSTTTNISSTNVNITATTALNITSGTTPTYIDNLSFKTNTITTKSGDLIFNSFTDLSQINSNIKINSKELRFNTADQKKISLNDTGYSAIGTQSDSMYFRSSNHYAWFRLGSHNNTFGQAGSGGTALAFLTGNNTSPPVTVDPLSRFYAGKVYNAVWNDIAECWDKAPNYEFEYGQVVVQTKQGVRPSKKRAEKATIGVISNTYGYLLNESGFNDLKTSKVVPIGITGRVKIKLKGKAEIGDEVVSYHDGMAIKASWFEKLFLRDRIIGMIDSIQDGYKIKIK